MRARKPKILPIYGAQKHYASGIVIALLCASYMIFSQFYVSASGGIQPAHYLIVSSSVLLLVFGKLRYVIDGYERIIILLLSFVAYTALSNFYWYNQSGTEDFILSALYYLFDILLLLSALFAMRYSNRQIIFSGVDIALILSLFIYLIGMGRYDFPPRYNGYFNDPNQMGLWALCLVAIRIIVQDAEKPNLRMDGAIGVAMMLVFATESRSALIGLFFLCAGYIVKRVKGAHRLVQALLIPAIFIGCALMLTGGVATWDDLNSQSALQRFEEINMEDDLTERGWYRIIQYPEYIIFGGGQGDHFRFNSEVEIHSTWAGILFYYGIVGSIFFFFPIIKIFFGLSFSNRFVFAAPLVYSLTTFSARTPIFWFFIAASISAIAAQSSRRLNPTETARNSGINSGTRRLPRAPGSGN